MPCEEAIRAYYAVNDAQIEAEEKAGRPFHDFNPGAILDVCAVCGKERDEGNHWDYSEPEFEDKCAP